MVFDSRIKTFAPPMLRSPASWEDFFIRFNDYLNNLECQRLMVDLRKIDFVTPEMVIVLISAARLWHRHRGTPISIDFTNEVQSYLARMNVLDECREWLRPMRIVHETLDRSSNSSRLMEVTPISSEEGKNAYGVVTATSRANQILQNADVPSDRTREIAKLLSEIGQNVVHSQDTGYAVIQRYRMKSRNAFCVCIGVGDLGYGIQKTLSDRYTADQLHCQVGSDYLVRALERKYSSRATDQGGAGLTHIQQRVIESKGELIIRSGSSRIWVKAGSVIQSDDPAFIPGVQVFITAYGTSDDWQ